MVEKEHLAENISVEEFNSLLASYPALIQSISDAKTPKPGQRSLADLDKFRYDEAPKAFSSSKPKRQATHDDVKTLVDWKLRHGKFRPTLMKLVSSNDEKFVHETIQAAMKDYWAKADAAAALDALKKLKGIGPATASLLLAVHDPENVIFFADEAYYWLILDGKSASLTYTAKEYRDLQAAFQKLAKRLGAKATDVEKVAYVLMKQQGPATTLVDKKQGKKAEATTAEKPSSKASTKRKQPSSETPKEQLPTRRSKRGKA